MSTNNPLFCVNCSAENPADSRFCRNCGRDLTVSQPSPPPFSGQQTSTGPGDLFNPSTSYRGAPTHINNNLVWAILATICCCIPTGIVSIVYAAQVNGKLSAGDFVEAQRYANNARTWAIISLVLGLLSIVVSVAYGLAARTV